MRSEPICTQAHVATGPRRRAWSRILVGRHLADDGLEGPASRMWTPHDQRNTPCFLQRRRCITHARIHRQRSQRTHTHTHHGWHLVRFRPAGLVELTTQPPTDWWTTSLVTLRNLANASDTYTIHTHTTTHIYTPRGAFPPRSERKKKQCSDGASSCVNYCFNEGPASQGKRSHEHVSSIFPTSCKMSRENDRHSNVTLDVPDVWLRGAGRLGCHRWGQLPGTLKRGVE